MSSCRPSDRQKVAVGCVLTGRARVLTGEEKHKNVHTHHQARRKNREVEDKKGQNLRYK